MAGVKVDLGLKELRVVSGLLSSEAPKKLFNFKSLINLYISILVSKDWYIGVGTNPKPSCNTCSASLERVKEDKLKTKFSFSLSLCVLEKNIFGSF